MAMRFGAFGKMPAVGDFFRIGPPVGFVRVWDTWVQNALVSAQQTFGDAWDGHYMSAPIWRFSLAAGLAGAQPVTGVMMPSVDRVGRRFPLTLVAPLPGEGAAELGHFARTALFEEAERLALDALEDGMTRDTLAERLGGIGPLPGTPLSDPCRKGGVLTLTAPEIPGALPSLAAALLAGRLDRPSLWSCIVAQREHVMICEGLPDGPRLAGLFDLVHPVWARGTAA